MKELEAVLARISALNQGQERHAAECRTCESGRLCADGAERCADVIRAIDEVSELYDKFTELADRYDQEQDRAVYNFTRGGPT